jgi:hypothetical protein
MKIYFYKLRKEHRYFGFHNWNKIFEIGFYYYNLIIDYSFRFWKTK